MIKSLINTRHERVVIKDKNRELKADVYIPREFLKDEQIQKEERVGGRTGILLLHGLGANSGEVYRMMTKGEILDHVLFVPRIDSITESKSRHMLRQASIDIELFMNEAKKYCDHLFVFGHSLGGYLTTFVLQNARVKNVEGICLIGTPYSFKEVMFKLGLNLLGFVGKRIETIKPIVKQLEKEMPELHYSSLEKKLYFHNFKFDNVDEVKDLFNAPSLLEISTPKVPMILIHGIDDEIISYNHSVLLYQKLRKNNRNVELNLIPFAGHHLKGMEKEAIEKINVWMRKIISQYKDI